MSNIDWLFKSLNEVEKNNSMFIFDCREALEITCSLVGKYYGYEFNGESMLDSYAASLMSISISQEMKDIIPECEVTSSLEVVYHPEKKLSHMDSETIASALSMEMAASLEYKEAEEKIIRIDVNGDVAILTVGSDYRVYEWTAYMEKLAEEVGKNLFVSTDTIYEITSIMDLCDRNDLDLKKALSHIYSGSYYPLLDSSMHTVGKCIHEVLEEARRNVDLKPWRLI